MEIMNDTKDISEPHASLCTKRCENSILVSCNWQITNNKQFIDVITTASLHASTKINCEDVAFSNTCIALQYSDFEPCIMDIKITNSQKIARIAIVSEGNVLEIFKQYGEYETTIIAEFIDDYEEHIVFLGETMIQPSSTEVSIKFARTRNKKSVMWIYGIRLFLIDSIKEAKPSVPDISSLIIQTFLSNHNDKAIQGTEMAMKLLEYYNKQKIINKEQFCHKNLEILASENSECKNEAKKDNEKDCSNCEDIYKKSNSVKYKSEIKRRDNECSNYEESYKKSDMDIATCINSETEFIKETKSDVFDCKDFIRTFLKNSNGNMSQEEVEMMIKMFECYNKQKIINNDEFYQGNLKTFASNSEYLEDKNKSERRDNEKENSNHEDEHKKLNSFENRNVKQVTKKDYLYCEDSKKSDIDIKTYIDNKFYDMENKLMERIDKMEINTNQKLNAILERLETLKLK